MNMYVVLVVHVFYRGAQCQDCQDCLCAGGRERGKSEHIVLLIA